MPKKERKNEVTGKINREREPPLDTGSKGALLAYIIVPGWRFLSFGYVNCIL